VRVQGTWVKARTRAWRRNLPNLIRNGHEPAHYVRWGRSLWGVKSPSERIMLRILTRSAHYAASSYSCRFCTGEVAQRHRAQRATYAAEWAISRQFLLTNWYFGEENLGHWKCDTYVETYSAIEWSINLVKIMGNMFLLVSNVQLTISQPPSLKQPTPGSCVPRELNPGLKPGPIEILFALCRTGIWGKVTPHLLALPTTAK